MADYRDEFKKLFESTFISSKGDKMSIYKEMVTFLDKVLSFMPDKLFRYRNLNNKYPLQSFKKGTISLCKANLFSDKYDSLTYIDVEKMVSTSEEAIRSAIQKVLNDIKIQNPLLHADKASPLCCRLEQGMSDSEIVDKVVKDEYSCLLNEIRFDLSQKKSRFRVSERTARIACFTESVQSKYMWDAYAGGYRGFALEYNFKDFLINCWDNGRPVFAFPVIYSDNKPDLTIEEANYCVFLKLKEKGRLDLLEPLRPFLDLNLLVGHKPYLYKDKEEYSHEKEWRMLYYDENNFNDVLEIPDDGCLKAIYYGSDITEKNYKKLHKIAEKKGIKEYKVSIDEDTPKYSLKINELNPS